MSIGEAFGKFLGEVNKEESFKLLDTYYESGGNFIDTANSYQDEKSEQWLGEWMEGRGIRDQIALATKYTNAHKQYQIKDSEHAICANYGGNHALHISVRDSLQKLRTDYMDILYVHLWDYTTSVEEVMQSLDVMVKSGKVLYLGISDTPAWIVSKANQYARAHALTPFAVHQGLWNVMVRDFEREIIPMCVEEGLALAPWGTAGSGRFKPKAVIEQRKKNNEPIRSFTGEEVTAQEEKVSAALEKIGREVGGSITSVAIAYCLQRCSYVFPIVGGRKVEHLLDNVKALDIALSKEQLEYLESQTPFDPGFPHNLIGVDPQYLGETQIYTMKMYLNMELGQTSLCHLSCFAAKEYPSASSAAFPAHA
ncbi:hypothetical protein BZG36_03812 [Bifiguratus adelaidae]|uniref:NADP-dependent oxidoreductase domain-containing protein n=1 Tax=Bifiguratus adelaidae TaxID=1938954 RepID=A0A261XZM4_9FUNG|nr:hypothetical protein BZG36_03812 [Bifiguratus adelaidae]